MNPSGMDVLLPASASCHGRVGYVPLSHVLPKQGPPAPRGRPIPQATGTSRADAAETPNLASLAHFG